MSASVEASEADVNLTPLLDVILQLIMFFMITVNFVRTEHLPPGIILPVAQTAIPMDRTAEDEVYLNIDKDGKLVGNPELEDATTLGKLKAYLTKAKEGKEREARVRGHKGGEFNILIVVRAHEDARNSQIWDVLHSCQKAGFKKWQIRALTGGGPAGS